MFLCCTWLEKEDFFENLHVLSCFVRLKSVLLISCVFWIFFSERWQSTLFQIFSKYFLGFIDLYPSFVTSNDLIRTPEKAKISRVNSFQLSS